MIDRNREGFFRPIHKYPLGWARLAAGSIPKLLLMFGLHILFAFSLVSDSFTDHPNITFTLVVVAFFPGMYLYALYRLLRIIESHDRNAMKSTPETLDG